MLHWDVLERCCNLVPTRIGVPCCNYSCKHIGRLLLTVYTREASLLQSRVFYRETGRRRRAGERTRRRREVSENATFDRNGDNFKTCFFNNSFERVDNGASVNVVNLVRYPPHPDSGCKSRERLARWFSPVSNRWKAASDGKIDFYSPRPRHVTSRRWFRYLFFFWLFSPFPPPLLPPCPFLFHGAEFIRIVILIAAVSRQTHASAVLLNTR